MSLDVSFSESRLGALVAVKVAGMASFAAMISFTFFLFAAISFEALAFLVEELAVILDLEVLLRQGVLLLRLRVVGRDFC